jgi:hypothetical protein
MSRLHLDFWDNCRIIYGEEAFASCDEEVNGWNISEMVFVMQV